MSRFSWICLAMVFLMSAGAISACQAADAPSSTSAAAMYDTTLPNGMKVICRQETATPLVALQVFIKVGQAQENPIRPGVSNFVAQTLLASTSNMVPESLQEQIGNLGGNVSTSWQPDYTQLSVLTVKDQFRDAVSLVADVLQNADFDSDVVESTRQDILQSIGTNDSSPFQIDYNGIRQSLYANSQYALPPSGTAQSVKRISRADLQAFFNRYYVPKNFVIIVDGNVSPDVAAKDIVADFEDFPTRGRGSSRPEATPPPLPFPTTAPAAVHTPVPNLAEVGVMIGYRVPTISDPAYPTVLVANALLGGMKTSRLFTNLREKQGLSYELGSLVNTQIAGADVTAYAFAAPTRIDPTTKKQELSVGFIKDQMMKQITGLRADPPTEADLIRAKHFLIGSYKIRHERLEDRATLLGIAALEAPEGTKFDTDYAHYINSVTSADIQRLLAKYFVHPAVSVVEPDTDQSGIVFD